MTDDISERYPELAGNPKAMAMFCRVLRERGHHDDALAMGMAASTAAPRDMEVRDLVRSGLSAGVPKWHVPMLNDHPRNAAYAAAITRLVKPGMLVFEIGSGAGLLAMLAARAGAEVLTCESQPAVAAVAAEVFRRNGLGDRITLLRKKSTEVVPADLPRPADLLLSELFGNTVFAEDILNIIPDAQKRLLKPGAIILPGKSALRCALIDMPRDPLLKPLATVEGFDLSPLNLLMPPSTSRTIRPNAATRRSPTLSALPMDYEASGSFGARRQRVSFVSDGGRVQGVAQWLRIDFGEGVTFENDPFASRSHWASSFFAFPEPIETQAGEIVQVDIRVAQAKLLMNLVEAG